MIEWWERGNGGGRLYRKRDAQWTRDLLNFITKPAQKPPNDSSYPNQRNCSIVVIPLLTCLLCIYYLSLP